MNQFFLALLLVLSGICYWLWNENKILIANNAALEGAKDNEYDHRPLLGSPANFKGLYK